MALLFACRVWSGILETIQKGQILSILPLISIVIIVHIHSTWAGWSVLSAIM